MRISKLPWRMWLTLLALLVACASSTGAGNMSSTTGGPMAGGHHGHAGRPMHGKRSHGGPDDGCPMALSDVHVRSEDIEGGVALSFTAGDGDVEELRRRVATMAEKHQQRSGGTGMHGMPAATASLEEIPDGVRLVLKAREPEQLDALRRHARTHAERMQQGECPMMARAPHDQ